MAGELQSLIDRIQKDGVQKADAEAAQILTQANKKAAALRQEAEEKARAIVGKAEEDAKVFAERGVKTIEQAARDIILTVGDGVQGVMQGLVARAVGESLTIETVKAMLVAVVQGYVAKGMGDGRIEVLVSAEDQKRLAGFLMERFKGALAGGIEIRAERRITKGFKVLVQDGRISHDFTQETIAEALSEFLRPQLAQIVQKAVQGMQRQGSG